MKNRYTKPRALRPGDTIAVLSPSWGGPGTFPHIYENGIATLCGLGLRVKEYPSTRMDATLLHKNPKLRAKDVNDAFADKNVKGIITSIGGDDSVRILPHLDKNLIRNNPKILLGFSDTTTLTTLCNQLGMVTLNGPSVMGGFSQWNAMPARFRAHVRDMLFSTNVPAPYVPYATYSQGYPAWKHVKNTGKRNPTKRTDGWHWVQGRGVARGELFGGCIEVLEFMKGTAFWPPLSFWKGKILFLETSEEKPVPQCVKYMLRNYGSQGVLDEISGILVGRAYDYTSAQKRELDRVLKMVVGEEFGRADLPIVSNMDFGHTDPQHIMPLGVRAEIDCKKKTFRLLEAPVR